MWQKLEQALYNITKDIHAPRFKHDIVQQQKITKLRHELASYNKTKVDRQTGKVS